MDLNVLKLLFFAYKDKNFTFYDKIIQTAHWTLINKDFVVKDKDEKVTKFSIDVYCFLLYYPSSIKRPETAIKR